MARFIWDPIHGAIRLTSFQTAVINTREFQRLRYIKQNGLLHFVFPGMTHTRFLHSLGTMHLARLAFESLFWFLDKAENTDNEDSRDYIRSVFLTTALLHDVGHVAFSHATEKIQIAGRPLLGSIDDFAVVFEDDQFSAFLKSINGVGDFRLDPEGVSHEILGAFFVRRILRQPSVVEQLSGGWNLAEYIQDVRALLLGNPVFTTSAQFTRAALSLLSFFNEAVRGGPIIGEDNFTPDQLPEHLRGVLCALLSSAFDVDRMDYLHRDAHYAGVPYGFCNGPFLLRNLCLISPGRGRLGLGLHEKSVHTLDDMLWSRYQMFIQVYTHKRNMYLNHVLGSAIETAISIGAIERPDTLPVLLAFTDDYVISSVLRFCHQPPNQDLLCSKILVDRVFPEHVDSIRMLPDETMEAFSDRVELMCSEEARERRIPRERVIHTGQTIDLLKGLLPQLFLPQRGGNPTRWKDCARESLINGSQIRPSHRIEHLYISE